LRVLIGFEENFDRSCPEFAVRPCHSESQAAGSSFEPAGGECTDANFAGAGAQATAQGLNPIRLLTGYLVHDDGSEAKKRQNSY
jgi:hypothetical protein